MVKTIVPIIKKMPIYGYKFKLKIKAVIFAQKFKKGNSILSKMQPTDPPAIRTCVVVDYVSRGVCLVWVGEGGG